jgi:acetyl esterase/lipase
MLYRETPFRETKFRKDPFPNGVWEREFQPATRFTHEDTMTLRKLLSLLLVAFSIAFVCTARADEPPFTKATDVVYGHKSGMALTMNVFTPKQNANGLGIVWVVSGGWVSSPDWATGEWILSPVPELTKRGYTVFAVMHGCQPKFIIPEILQDMNRAVRFIRLHANDYHIDPEHIGITGGSAGGHLSLMQGTAGDLGNPKATDPLEGMSSRVQAVACFFPPTDFLNYGKEGNVAFKIDGTLKAFRTAVDLRELDQKTGQFEHVTDEKKLTDLYRNISPITHVQADSAPSLIIHGDKDFLVPIQQAEIMVAKLKEAGVPAELVVKKGAAHGWNDIGKDYPTIADWFDKYLKKRS